MIEKYYCLYLIISFFPLSLHTNITLLIRALQYDCSSRSSLKLENKIMSLASIRIELPSSHEIQTKQRNEFSQSFYSKFIYLGYEN